MRNSYRIFIDALTEATDAHMMREVLADLAVAFGFPMFAYLSGKSIGRAAPDIISNYAGSWTDHYLRHRYSRLDPVIEMAARSSEPFIWDENAYRRNLTKSQREFFEEARAHGITAGLTIPLVNGAPTIAALTFASSSGVSIIRKAAERHGSALQLVALLAHRRAKSLLSNGYVIGEVRLSRREHQCLLWASRGKSAWETGQILRISQRTVESYWESVRAKLQVHTMTQAAVLLALSTQRQDLS